MKIFSYTLLVGMLFLASCATMQKAENMVVDVVEASCGICKFDMTGDECALAVKIDGKYYYVEGTTIDAHGDPHGEKGFCNAVRKAKVTGRIKNGVFKAESFELIE